MLKLMADHMFNPPKDVQSMHCGGEQMLVLLDRLLDKMEEAGMLPPGIVDHTIWDRSTGNSAVFNEWEPEDE